MKSRTSLSGLPDDYARLAGDLPTKSQRQDEPFILADANSGFERIELSRKTESIRAADDRVLPGYVLLD